MRVCLNAGATRADVLALARAVVEWARTVEEERRRARRDGARRIMGSAVGGLLESKL